MGRYLEQTARIRGHDDIDLRPLDRLRFQTARLFRNRRMGEVVCARAAAAPLAVGELDQRDTGDRAQKRAGLRSDPLPMREVTGILIGDAQTRSRGGSSDQVTRKKLGDVADTEGEPLSAVAPGGGVAQDDVVRLE